MNKLIIDGDIFLNIHINKAEIYEFFKEIRYFNIFFINMNEKLLNLNKNLKFLKNNYLLKNCIIFTPNYSKYGIKNIIIPYIKAKNSLDLSKIEFYNLYNFNIKYGNIVHYKQIYCKINLIFNYPKKPINILYFFHSDKIIELIINKKLLLDYNNIIFYYLNPNSWFNNKIKFNIIFIKYFKVYKRDLLQHWDSHIIFKNLLNRIYNKNKNIWKIEDINWVDFINRYDIIIKVNSYLKYYNIDIIKVPKSLLINKNEEVSTILNKMKNNNLNFPVIIKTNESLFNNNAHKIYFIKSLKGFKNFSKINSFDVDYVIQSYIEHNSDIYKFYEFLNYSYIYENNSIGIYKDLIESEFIDFKTNTNFILKYDLKLSQVNQNLLKSKNIDISKEQADQIIGYFKNIFGYKLFGIDIIREINTGQLYFIDYNYFPNFNNIGDCRKILENFIANYI